MFNTLQTRFGDVVKHLRGQARLTEENIKDSLRDVRMALLEADVALPVVRDFIEQIRVRALGAEVARSLTPGQVLIKIVHDELVKLMGEVNETLNLNTQPPAVILLAGLQGSGKTTSAAKLARWLQERHKKRVMLTSCDVYRPAAIEQLATLTAEINATFFPSDVHAKPAQIALAALEAAHKQLYDVLIVDTAGRLAIDAMMMTEIQQIHAALNPIETLFVVDSMTGQDAAKTARAFHETLPLTGVILTKADGDARGGAALSIRQLTGQPIKFIGVGEKTAALEPFYPDRLASRILGMGDVVTLVEEMQQKFDHTQAEQLANKLRKGRGLDLVDFRDQLNQMNKLGGMTGLLDKLPGMNQVPDHVKNQINDRELMKLIAIIDSMTPQERAFPQIIKGSRRRRIALGSGTRVQDVNQLLKQFTQMQKMMKKMKGGNMAKLMRQMSGNLPPGMGLPFK
ncbi:signal recognition particle protein [Thiospirillum jenense]|uniref:Signal recognition particle protein n=1 Tax=Thiospirillum jenense TaxID=1653858 RepID=A0A839HAW6_9GAMM|nr:signal recognition particle protein [Thiospirillum jenense]MBB1126195.1 signal recognition particle protein [Thiospirillum jenense]